MSTSSSNRRAPTKLWSTVAQVTGSVPLAESLGSTLAVGYYYYSDTSPDGATDIVDQNRGNELIDSNGDGELDAYASRFGTLHPILSFEWRGWVTPLTLAGEYMINTLADSSENQGWAVGIAAGEARVRGDLRVYYQWQAIEREAIFSPYAQDDFLYRTNHSSHLVGANYQIVDKVGVHVWGMISKPIDLTPVGESADGSEDWRVRVDLNIRF